MEENIITSLFRGIADTFRPKEIKLADPIKKDGGSKDKFNEVGVKGEQLIRSFEKEEIRQDNLKITDYRRMIDNDGQVQMLINAIFNTILSAGITIQDDPSLDQEEESEEKKFVEENLLSPKWKNGMELSMEMTNRYKLRSYIEGYRIFEVVYRLDPDGKIRLRKLAPRAGNDDFELKILVDDNGNFLGYKQKLSWGGKSIDVRVVNDGDIKKVHHVVYGGEFGSLYGRSGLRAAWYHYDKAHKGMFINHVGQELGVINPKIIYTIGNTTETERQNVLKAFDRIHMESTIMLPKESFEVEFAKITDPGVMAEGREMVNLHYSMIAKSILAQFIDLGSGMSKTGSRALGESQTDFFKQGLQSVARVIIEDTWNEIIADLVKINFGSEIYPRLVVNQIDDNSAQMVFDMLLEMTKKGEIPDVLRNKLIARGSEDLGMEVSEDEIQAEMQEKEAKEEEAMQKQSEMKQQELQASMQMKQQMAKQTAKAQKLSEIKHKHVELNDINIPEQEYQEPVVRPLYLDEQKVKLADIKVKLDDSKARAELILSNKLNMQKNRIVDSYVKALRDGRSAIRNIDIDLADTTTYNDELKELSNELFEYGKRVSANEIGKPVPTTPRREMAGVNERADVIAQEQEDRLKLKLQMVANDALDNNIPENDAKILLEQEYDGFWNKVLVPTVGMMISKMFNMGRKLSFEKYKNEVFAYRYTAVLDARTTDYCRELDGKVFQASDPNYSLLTPPNHFGCRSFWTPILNTESEGVEVEGKPMDFPVYSSVDTFKDLQEEEKTEEELISLMEEYGQDKTINS